MIFNEIQLSKNHWSLKLLKFVFPYISRFNNFCPHFWLTFLSLIIVLPVSIYKVIKFVFIKCMVTIDNIVMYKIEHRFDKSSNENKILGAYFAYKDSYAPDALWRLPIRTCEERKILKLIDLFEHSSVEIRDKYRKLIDTDKNTIQDIKNMLDKLEEEGAEYYKKRDARIADHKRKKQEREDKYKKHVPILIKGTKIAIIPMMVVAAIYILYYLFFFLGWIWYWISVFFVGNGSVLFSLLLIFIGCLLIMGIVYVSYKLLIKIVLTLNFGSCEFWRKIGKPFVAIGNVLNFLWTGIKTLKSDNCPGIVWKEDEKDN